MAWNQAAYSFNTNTNRGNATANNNPVWLMKGGAAGDGFIYYDQDLNLINNDQFGTCTLDSLDPLTITYTINDGVTWSDGTPVDAADLLLEWAAESGVFNDANTVVTDTGVTAQADADGAPIVVGPDGAEIDSSTEAGLRDGVRRRRRAARRATPTRSRPGVSFDTASESFQLVTQVPGDLRRTAAR